MLYEFRDNRGTGHVPGLVIITLAVCNCVAVYGAPKLLDPQGMTEVLPPSLALIILVGLAEVLAGTSVIVGSLVKTPLSTLATRMSGLAAIPVLLGAIVLVHGPRWSFVAMESYPLGGMEYQVTLLGIALFFLLTGGRLKEVDND